MAIFPRIISISLACVSSICNRIGTSVPPSKPGRRRHLTWLEELLKNLHRHLRCVEQFEPNKMMEFCKNRWGVRDETASNFSILSSNANQFLFGFCWSSAPTLESLRSLLWMFLSQFFGEKVVTQIIGTRKSLHLGCDLPNSVKLWHDGQVLTKSPEVPAPRERWGGSWEAAIQCNSYHWILLE